MAVARNPVPKLLTVREFADLSRHSPRQVARWIAAGELRVHRFGRGVRIAQDDARSFIAAARQ
jgi:excisionase family DNA binding protein